MSHDEAPVAVDAPAHHHHHHHVYTTEPRKWIALGCLCAIGGINSAQQMNWASLTKASKAHFGIDAEELDWLVASFYLCFLLFSFFSVVLFERYGLRFVLLLASCLNTASTLCKLLAVRWYAGYWTLFLSQFVAALAQPLYMPLPPALAMIWFSDDTRAIATSVAALCTALGTALGMMYAPFIVTGDGSTELFVQYLTVQAIASTIETVVNFLFNREEPDEPPSAAAALRRTEAHKHHHLTIPERTRQILKEVSTYFCEKNRALLLIGGGIFVGTLYAVPAAMCQLFAKWGISNSSCGLMSGAIIVVGLIVGTAAGLYVDATKKYRSTLLICACMGVVGMIVAAVVIIVDSSNVWVLGACITVGGAPLLAAFGIVMDAAAEETFPLDEVFSSTVVVYVGCVMAFVEMNLVPQILDSSSDGKRTSMIVWGIFLVCMVTATVCLFFWQPTLPRVKFEQSKREDSDDGQDRQDQPAANEAEQSLLAEA